MIKYAIYDAKLGVYWDATSIGLQRYHDTIAGAVADWESDNPPKTPQKQQASFSSITGEWCVPVFYKQCRFFVHEVVLETAEYKLLPHNEKECTYEDEQRNNKYGRTLNFISSCKHRGFEKNPKDARNPFINKLHR